MWGQERQSQVSCRTNYLIRSLVQNENAGVGVPISPFANFLGPNPQWMRSLQDCRLCAGIHGMMNVWMEGKGKGKGQDAPKESPTKGTEALSFLTNSDFPHACIQEMVELESSPTPTTMAISSLPWAEGGSYRQAGTRRGSQSCVSREQRVCDRDLAERRGGAAKTGPHKSQGSVPLPYCSIFLLKKTHFTCKTEIKGGIIKNFKMATAKH